MGKVLQDDEMPELTSEDFKKRLETRMRSISERKIPL